MLALTLIGQVIAHSTPAALAESEPNDTPASAQAIGVGWQAAETGASLSSGADTDWYRFTACAGCTYVLEAYQAQATTASGGPEFAVFAESNPSQALTASAYGFGNIYHRAVWTAVTAGAYLVRVDNGLSNWAAAYRFRVLPGLGQADTPSTPWDATDDFEPDGGWPLAYPLPMGLGGALARSLTPLDDLNYETYSRNDEDWFRFDVQAGQTYAVEVFDVAKRASVGYGTTLRVYAPEGLAGDLALGTDSYSNGKGRVLSRVLVTAAATTTYFARVTSLTPSWFGAYHIRVVPAFGSVGAEWDTQLEPNDLRQQAPLVALDSAVSSALPAVDPAYATWYPDDVDWYRVNVVAGQRLVVETYDVLIPTDNGRPGLALYNSPLSANSVAEDRMGANGLWGSIARLVYDVPTTGTYFVEVTTADFHARWTGAYTLKLCLNECPRQLVLLPVIRTR